MARRTALIRIRFPRDVVVRLDEIAKRLKVARAAVIRAIVALAVERIGDARELADALVADTVRRGQAKGTRFGPRRPRARVAGEGEPAATSSTGTG